MKKILLSLFAVMLVISVSAQRRVGFGPKVGMNAAMLSDKAFDARISFNAGLFVEYDLSAAWSLELSAIYSSQGAKMENVPVTLTEKMDATLRLDYINIPLVVKFYPWMGMNIFLGPQYSMLVDAQQKFKDQDATSVKKSYKKCDFGGVVGLGYTWECGMLISAQYNMGFLPIYKDKKLDKVYNNVFQVNLGWRF